MPQTGNNHNILHGWMGKLLYTYIMEYYLAMKMDEPFNNLDGSQRKCFEWKKQISKSHTLFAIYITSSKPQNYRDGKQFHD